MRRHFQLLLFALALSACNQDEVIEQGEPEGGTSAAETEATPYASRVFDYTPAPGQFINEPEPFASPEAACAWAEERLSEHQYVSLGAFGGYIVAGFDHDVTGDFLIEGNAFVSKQGSSNEPGVVSVMADTNGNGLPDDEWVEIRGGDPNAVSNYSVTYRRPSAPGKDVEWTASDGTAGVVKYLPFHKQDYYYPAWIKADEYTLTGTLLPSRTTYDPATRLWDNPAFEWGYADNAGSDADDATVRFRLPDGVKAIRFVKVQSAVMQNAGPLGEVSTEVCSIADCSLLK